MRDNGIGGNAVRTRYLSALSALAFAGLLVMNSDSGLAQKTSGASVGKSSDSGGSGALKICRDKIVKSFKTGSLKKLGQVESLPGASVTFRTNTTMQSNLVPVSRLRLYRARALATNFWGVTQDFYAVCFFEKRDSGHRFVQVCTTKSLTSKFHPCDTSWISGDYWYNKVQKERSQ